MSALNPQGPQITAGALVSAILPQLNLDSTTERSTAVPGALSWSKDSDYGLAIKSLLPKDVSNTIRRNQQLSVLYAAQSYCADRNYPVMWVSVKADKGEKKVVQKKLVALLFQTLYTSEIVEEDVFLYWADEDESDAVKGKLTAVVQTSELLQVFRARGDSDGDEDDEEEEEDIGAPREFIK